MGWAETAALAKPAGRPRILIDNVDITFFRGKATPVPRLTLTEPYAYGATDIQIPAIHAGLEMGECGAPGELSWVRPDARVTIQMVDNPLAETPVVLATLYEGWVDDIECANGRLLNLPCSGLVSGHGNWMHRPPPRFRRLADVGHWAGLFAQAISVPFEPFQGPETGIELADDGDMSELAWMDQVGQNSQQRDGRMRAFMPKGEWGSGVWEFEFKNTTDVDFTLFNDDGRITLDLQRVSLEETNTYWGRGVSPEGVRWFNARYPGLRRGSPAPYPFTDERNFGLGTTDADTDTGDGVQILSINLIEMLYLEAQPPYDGVYDQRIYDAVADLKRDAGLSDNGTMTIAAWNALWDVDATGYSAVHARCVPLLQDSEVRKWNLTRNGSYAGHNAGFNKNRRRRDRAIDYGRMRKPQAITWARGDHTKATATKNWVGTIRLNGFSGWAGQLDDPDGLTVDDIFEPWRMRPGMNVWLPYFDGGTKFHVSGAELEESDLLLHVDTRARDLMDLVVLQQRDQDARRNIRREWRIENRGTKASGNLVTTDEYGGQLDEDRPLVGGQWNVIDIPIGQHGQINRTDILVTGLGGDGEGQTGWCMAVVARQWTPEQFQHRIGNPFPVNADGESVWEQPAVVDLYDDGILLYSAGDERQPCGYWPRKHTNDVGLHTDAPITGRWRDDAPWPYIMPPTRVPIITVGIYPATDGVLKRRHLFKKQEDDAV